MVTDVAEDTSIPGGPLFRQCRDSLKPSQNEKTMIPNGRDFQNNRLRVDMAGSNGGTRATRMSSIEASSSEKARSPRRPISVNGNTIVSAVIEGGNPGK